MKNLRLTVTDEAHARLEAAAITAGYPGISSYLLATAGEENDRMSEVVAGLGTLPEQEFIFTDITNRLQPVPSRGEIITLSRRFKRLVELGAVPTVTFLRLNKSNHAIYQRK